MKIGFQSCLRLRAGIEMVALKLLVLISACDSLEFQIFLFQGKSVDKSRFQSTKKLQNFPSKITCLGICTLMPNAEADTCEAAFHDKLLQEYHLGRIVQGNTEGQTIEVGLSSLGLAAYNTPFGWTRHGYKAYKAISARPFQSAVSECTRLESSLAMANTLEEIDIMKQLCSGDFWTG